ncbi:MAG: Aminotransferase class-III [Candidatus Gottesmanbacteria bacterium GW2011_GWA1_34_13]|uniref:Aminotransferase class-III n=1 Tax=Candidatus Gottesmanbacteria bacterium GW2011_GWA1_34_13 TaxID=1618434 RepID=A0A0G0DXV0_9BACT|nr:MAG: Aminotransferase class-III [Candidatus Gottesmanbacteria bacterium GW2011_GWA1_34_13]
MDKSQRLYKIAKQIIPGGTQLLSKRPEMFLPDLWPAYYSRAKGCEVWDLDGRHYFDMSYMGIGASIIGYANKEIDNAALNAINKGNMCTLNNPEEVELAKLLIKLHPWAQQVRYSRTGGEAMAIAVRIARAATGKDKILFCGYHGWHDWYLAANLNNDKALDDHLLPGLESKGVPRSLLGTAVPFTYNNLLEFTQKFDQLKKDLAAVVMEPIRNTYPNKDFLTTIRSRTQKYGVALIFDEVTAGFRLSLGGAHLKLDINPDIAVLGKAISNGFPMAAIIGKSSFMNAAQDSFISSTFWTDRCGPTTALATIKFIKTKKIIPYINKIGKFVQNGWRKIASKNHINITISGIYPLSHFEFNYPNSQAIKTLMIQIMLEKGFLVTNAFYVSYAHKVNHINNYLKHLDTTFSLLSKYIKENNIESHLKSTSAHKGFFRLT